MTTKPEVAKDMKAVAEAHPWRPVSIPPQRHYRTVDGLNLCFTLDSFPDRQLYHLSISRLGLESQPTDEEVAPWLQAFFGDVKPFEMTSALPARHFFLELIEVHLS